MATILFDIFTKTKDEKPEYLATGFENKFADEQRADGREPWVDVNFSRKVGDKRVRAVAIVYEDGSKLSLKGKWPKLGFRKGFTLLPEDELETDSEYDDGDDIDTDSL